MESLNLRNTWISYLNVSLKVHAGRQIIQTLNKFIKTFVTQYVNPPCKSSLATSCAKSTKANSNGRVAAFFTEGVSSSAEGELATDETASTVSLAPNVCVVPGVSAPVEESEECVGEFVSPVSGKESAARPFEEEADDNDSFVDIMSGITAVGGAESEGWTFVDALARANLSRETLAEIVVDTSTHLVCLHVSLLSSFPISFKSVGTIWWPLLFSFRYYLTRACS